ncbi:catalase family protein [Allorhizobium pseudoryzae]|uniref:catalase family protein n=1 Tax=Allorhizobium pseudoryzae TaxID=379684 RepID=UPI003D03C577
MTRLPENPQRYHEGVEDIRPDEPQVAEALADTMLSIAYKTYADSAHAIRCVHAKSHALLGAEVEVHDNLPPDLAQGLFARPATYDAVIRLSTTPGDILHDSVSAPRGMALKILDVAGDRLPGAEHSTSQDFVMVNGKVFNSPSGEAFLGSLKLLAATTNRAEGAKKVLSKILRGAESVAETLGKELTPVKVMGGQPMTHMLGESFYTQVPVRYGAYIAKLGVVPASDNLKALIDSTVSTAGDPDTHRHLLDEFFERETAVWHLKAQLCTHLDEMPVEDPMALWDEEKSPYFTVATITAGPQTAWSDDRSEQVDDGMKFSPWNGIAAHQPLGQIMRLRKLAYERSAAFRSERNPTPVTEPARCPFAHGSAGNVVQTTGARVFP